MTGQDYREARDKAIIDCKMMQLIRLMKNAGDINHIIRYHAQMDLLNSLLWDIRSDGTEYERAEDDYYYIDNWIQSFADRRIKEIWFDRGIADILDYEW